MAFEMGISQKAYSDIENSKVKINLDILTKISSILEIRPSDICSISDQCSGGNYEEKYNELINFIRNNNLPLPEGHS